MQQFDLRDSVLRAAAGEAEAQGELMTRYLPLARARAVRLVDPSAVDDVVQDAFLDLFTTIDRLRHPEALPAWIALTVRKHADRHRRRLRPTTELSDDAVTEDPLEAHAERSELKVRVRSALLAAGDRDRRLLELRYLAGWSIDDLADVLEVSNGVVRKRLHDARRRLRPALQDLHDRKAIPMTDYERHLGAVHAPDALDLGDPPPVARPAAREPIPTGLKILDVVAPISRGGTVEMVGPAGTGHLILVVELAQRLNRNDREPVVIAAASTRQSVGAWSNLAKLVTELEDNDRHAVVICEDPGDASATVRDAALLARGVAAAGVDVLLVVDKATSDDSGGPQALKQLAGLSPGGGSITVILLDPYEDGQPLPPDAGMDTRLVFSADQLARRIFPALDPVLSHAKFHTNTLTTDLRNLLVRSEEIRRYFDQPMVVAEDYTGEAPTWVDRTDAETELEDLLA